MIKWCLTKPNLLAEFFLLSPTLLAEFLLLEGPKPKPRPNKICWRNFLFFYCFFGALFFVVLQLKAGPDFRYTNIFPQPRVNGLQRGNP